MNTNENPKCSTCRTYFIPTLKTSGLPYKCCNKCRKNSLKSKNDNKCEHNRIRNTCKECGGISICEHNKQKSNCKECCGGSICEHNRRRNNCKECKGGSICEHNRIRSRCKECKGSGICEHNKRRNQCKECNPLLCLINIQRGQINRCFKSSTLHKNKHSIEYLGCDIETFICYFQKKIDYFNTFIATDEIMSFDNIHIDHIKPISKFDLDNEDDFLDCCHYTNLQPLVAKDNLEKSNKWTDENEIYWNNNIKGNIDYIEIYLL